VLLKHFFKSITSKDRYKENY